MDKQKDRGQQRFLDRGREVADHATAADASGEVVGRAVVKQGKIIVYEWHFTRREQVDTR
jgi:hypothetical protein